MSEQKQEVLSHELLAAIGDYGHAKYRHDNDIITLGAWEDLITAIKVWNRSALAAKDARIAELEGLLREAKAYHGVMLLTDPPREAWKQHQMDARIAGALAAQQQAEPATPSEDGREAPKFDRRAIADRVNRMCVLMAGANTLNAAEFAVEECQSELERIVAAKDAEIARLDAGWHEANKRVLEVSLAQPARQVGADSPEWSDAQVHDFLSVALRHVEVEGTLNFQDIRDAMRYMREKYGAALAPAAVVMPERLTFDPEDVTGENECWVNSRNATLDEVARLNLRAIPAGLLERVCTWAETFDDRDRRDAAIDELRALLGKS